MISPGRRVATDLDRFADPERLGRRRVQHRPADRSDARLAHAAGAHRRDACQQRRLDARAVGPAAPAACCPGARRRLRSRARPAAPRRGAAWPRPRPSARSSSRKAATSASFHCAGWLNTQSVAGRRARASAICARQPLRARDAVGPAPLDRALEQRPGGGQRLGRLRRRPLPVEPFRVRPALARFAGPRWHASPEWRGAVADAPSRWARWRI